MVVSTWCAAIKRGNQDRSCSVSASMSQLDSVESACSAASVVPFIKARNEVEMGKKGNKDAEAIYRRT